MRAEKTIFYDVDTQRDFILPGGALYASGAEKVIVALGELTKIARECGIRMAGSVDRHFPGDAELKRNRGEFPDHCMDGTDGQHKIDATTPLNPLWVENRQLTTAEWRAALSHHGELIIEKQRFDVFSGNRNAQVLLAELTAAYDDIVVYGVCTDVCVDFAVKGLIRLRPRVTVVSDAIAGLDAERSKGCVAAWIVAGVEVIGLLELERRLGC